MHLYLDESTFNKHIRIRFEWNYECIMSSHLLSDSNGVQNLNVDETNHGKIYTFGPVYVQFKSTVTEVMQVGR